MDKEAIVVVSEMLNSEDFYEQQYAALYETMLELHNEGKAVDLVTLQEKLRKRTYLPKSVV